MFKIFAVILVSLMVVNAQFTTPFIPSTATPTRPGSNFFPVTFPSYSTPAPPSYCSDGSICLNGKLNHKYILVLFN